MARAHRSPLLGYNHNVGHLGRVFHVQTEDSGPVSPRVFTHLFHEGTILVSRKVEYEALIPDDKVRGLMQTQHRAVIKDLASGLFNERIVAFFRNRGVELEVAPAAMPVALAVVDQGSIPTAAIADSSASLVGVPAPAPEPTLAPAPAVMAGPVPTPAPGSSPTAPGVVVTAAPTTAPRRNTRPLETGRARRPEPVPVVSGARPPDARRPPFVRSSVPVAKTTSADGVVVQRSVVIGGISTADSRPRIRPPVPYIVTGGSHPVRQSTAAEAKPDARTEVKLEAPSVPSGASAPKVATPVHALMIAD